MNISSVSSTNPLLKQLESSGLSANKAKLVQSDLAAAKAATSAGASVVGLSPSVRAAFDTKIAADVSSGKLSASDAAAVKKTMDNLDGGSSAAATATQGNAGAAQASGAAGAKSSGGGGGGGGGSSSKTELSESVTISGATMTTVTTYTDGTTSTTTTTASDADKAKYDKHRAGDTASVAADGYTPAIDKGSLVDQVA